MSGSSIINELLEADPVLAVAAEEQRIKEDLWPENVELPAYLVRTISSTDRNNLTPGPFIRSFERISVTVRASSVRERKAEIDRVREAGRDRVGDFAGCFRVSVLTNGRSPTLIGPGNTFEQTQDFIVSFDRPVSPGGRS
jgi:hypothetical protein